jgi:hypothetical protein
MPPVRPTRNSLSVSDLQLGARTRRASWGHPVVPDGVAGSNVETIFLPGMDVKFSYNLLHVKHTPPDR